MRSWTDDGMNVTINNWRQDEAREGRDDRKGRTMDYLPHAARRAHRCPWDSDPGDADILHTG